MKKISFSLLSLSFMFFLSCKGQAQQTSPVHAGATPILVQDGFAFTEGPAADKKGNVFFTDQPNDRILKWDASTGKVETYMEPSGRANGLYVAPNGDLLACADNKNELWRIDKNKKETVLVDGFNGMTLNGPNDLWVDRKGGIYFTDPLYPRPYWTENPTRVAEKQVYYLAPGAKEIQVVASDLKQPNGIVGTPDGKTLYVADINDSKTYSFHINKDGSLSDRKLFVDMGSDGMTLDSKGNVYLSGKGITIFNKAGEKIGHIPIDQNWTANVTFGGKDRKTLFITASTAVYTVAMDVAGPK